MNDVAKKRIVEISGETLSAICVLIAVLCVFARIKSSKYSNRFESINIFAARSVFSRGAVNCWSSFKNNIFGSFEDNYIYRSKGDNNDANKNPFASLKPAETSLPNISLKPETEKSHEGEAKYKIIENSFTSGGTKHENFYVKNTTGQNIDIGFELNQKPEINITRTKEPQVLIFHTHTSESYMNFDEGFFYEGFYPRSLENSENVTAVGKIIADKLTENGINTVHDTTYHDSPSYNGSYSRAAQTIKKNLKEHPSIQVVIDIHRDSMGSKETGKIKPTFKYKNQKAAQLMIISGCDPNGSLGFPNWEKNLRLALRLQKYCESMFPGITRPLNFSKVKYNEHLTPGSLLIEVGSDANTLEEALRTGDMLGQSLAKLLNDIKN